MTCVRDARICDQSLKHAVIETARDLGLRQATNRNQVKQLLTRLSSPSYPIVQTLPVNTAVNVTYGASCG